jgi:hypothetical protein
MFIASSPSSTPLTASSTSPAPRVLHAGAAGTPAPSSASPFPGGDLDNAPPALNGAGDVDEAVSGVDDGDDAMNIPDAAEIDPLYR